jgi:hypothetical protein
MSASQRASAPARADLSLRSRTVRFGTPGAVYRGGFAAITAALPIDVRLVAPRLPRLCSHDNPSVPPIDTQQRRLLERLRHAGEEPVAFAELRRGGIDFPAAVVSELEMLGYAIERAYDRGRLIGVRLAQPERDDTREAVVRRRLGRTGSCPERSSLTGRRGAWDLGVRLSELVE